MKWCVYKEENGAKYAILNHNTIANELATSGNTILP